MTTVGWDSSVPPFSCAPTSPRRHVPALCCTTVGGTRRRQAYMVQRRQFDVVFSSALHDAPPTHRHAPARCGVRVSETCTALHHIKAGPRVEATQPSRPTPASILRASRAHTPAAPVSVVEVERTHTPAAPASIRRASRAGARRVDRTHTQATPVFVCRASRAGARRGRPHTHPGDDCFHLPGFAGRS